MRLAHDRGGSGPPLVLVHGTGSRRGMWDPVVGALARERDTIAVDLPGFGESPPLAAGRRPTPAALSDALIEFWGELGVERPHLAGNSLGGGIALELARRGVVASAVAISPIGFGNAPEDAWCEASLWLTRALARSLRPRAPRLLEHRLLKAAMLGQMFGRPGRLSTEDALADIDGLIGAPAFHAAIPNIHRWKAPRQSELQAPVTIAWGTRDRLLPPWQAKRARERLPQATHAWLPGCGHVAPNDDPELVARVILAGTAG